MSITTRVMKNSVLAGSKGIVMRDKKEGKGEDAGHRGEDGGASFRQGGDDDHREQIEHDLVAQGEVRKDQEIESGAQHHATGGQEIISPESDQGARPKSRDRGMAAFPER